MKNILENDKKDEKAHRYIKTNYIDVEKKNDNENYGHYRYKTTYNVTPQIPEDYNEIQDPSEHDSSTNM